MNDPVIESIKRQRREAAESNGREAFNAFHHDIAPAKKKGLETLKAFLPISVEATKLASEASSIPNPPAAISGLIQDIFNLCHSVPLRINGAIAEIDATTPHDLAFDAEHEAKYGPNQSKLNRLIVALSPGDVCRALQTQVSRLREELAWLAKNAGVDTLTTIPAAPVVKPENRTVKVNSAYNPLKK